MMPLNVAFEAEESDFMHMLKKKEKYLKNPAKSTNNLLGVKNKNKNPSFTLSPMKFRY